MYRAINAAVDRLEAWSMTAFMAIAVIITVFQVIYRVATNGSLYWGEEVVIYSIICMSFIGASMGVRHGAHISVGILNAFAGPKLNKALHILAALVGIVFASFLAFYGFELFANTLKRGQLTPALRIPMAWVYLPMAISGLLLMHRYIWLICKTIKQPPMSYADEIAAEKDNLI